MRFGTDGVRGRAGTELTSEFALALGRAAATVLGGHAGPGEDAGRGDVVVLGGDTRESTPALLAALAAGFMTAGVDVVDLGVASTPHVAFEAQRRGALGGVVSASHNPFHDNGIKLFGRGGRKLADAVQTAIEAELDAPTSHGERFGTRFTVPADDHDAAYIAHLLGVLEGRRLDGLRIVVDVANGAARSAPAVFRAAGAEVIAIAANPDGRNINAGCGATHPDHVAAAVVESSADLGIALDGDADRLIAVDHTGRVVDGDHLIAMCADDLRARGRLAHDTVVVTVMTNLGFRLAMRERGISVVETPVGDRYVLEALASGGFSLGGEQSGHVVFADHATTGDGVLTALAVLDIVARTGSSLAVLADGAMRALPQSLVNVAVARPDPGILTAIADVVAGVETRLGHEGRVLVRASGTEPLIRVMVEAPTQDAAAAAAIEIAAAVTSVAANR